MPRQVLLAIVLWMLLTVPSATGGPDLVEPEKVVNDLVTGHRPVLLFTKPPASHHSLLIVGSQKSKDLPTTKLEDTYVFNVKLEHGATSALLTDMKSITTRWPRLSFSSYKHIFAIGHSFVLVGHKTVRVFDSINGTLSKMSLNRLDRSKLQHSHLLSCSQTPTFYYTFVNKGETYLFQVKLDNAQLNKAKKFNFTTSRTICYDGKQKLKIKFQSGVCLQWSVDWKISTGFVAGDDFVLVEDKNNSIIQFTSDVFEKKQNNSSQKNSVTSIQRISADQFWRYQKWTPTTSSTTSSSHKVIIIIGTMAFLFAILFPAVVYFIWYFFLSSKKKSQPEGAGPGGKVTAVTSNASINLKQPSSLTKKMEISSSKILSVGSVGSVKKAVASTSRAKEKVSLGGGGAKGKGSLKVAHKRAGK